jgi:hypothetical protein
MNKIMYYTQVSTICADICYLKAETFVAFVNKAHQIVL